MFWSKKSAAPLWAEQQEVATLASTRDPQIAANLVGLVQDEFPDNTTESAHPIASKVNGNAIM